MKKEKVGLCMIVRNEASVIKRCLDSVRNLIDYWTIVDTGSTDGTQEVIQKELSDIPGQLLTSEWQDFAYNRSEAIVFARDRADYTLIIDADDYLETISEFVWPKLDKDAYTIEIKDSSITYCRVQLISNQYNWRYEGVLHEYLTRDGRGTEGMVQGLWMRRGHDGARRRDPETYRKDAQILERAFENEKRDELKSRYAFYLAQSYRDCREYRKSIEWYRKRSILGFWDQEVYVSLLTVANLRDMLDDDPEEVLQDYFAAIKIDPSRAEAYYGAAKLLRVKLKKNKESRDIAFKAIDLKPVKGGLFVANWIYQYGLLDELAVSAYWANLFEESFRVCELLINQGFLPDKEKDRVKQNLEFSRAQIQNKTTGDWQPSTAQGGTEIMAGRVLSTLGSRVHEVDLRINSYDFLGLSAIPKKPLVVWIHHDIDQQHVHWLKNSRLRDRVDAFIFVSHWQREQYELEYKLDSRRCYVIRNAVQDIIQSNVARSQSKIRVAYTSTPFRGLDILLEVWKRLKPEAELNIWSSLKLYGPDMDDTPYLALYEQAKKLPNVIYHGLLPNNQLCKELSNMDILAYPSTFRETSCMSVMEAMMAGCKIVCPQLGSLPETTAGFASLYPVQQNFEDRVQIFGNTLQSAFKELDTTEWRIQRSNQISYAKSNLSWTNRQHEWHKFFDLLKK
jgi:glycosyltransferase involved in cell wall biosynthesis